MNRIVKSAGVFGVVTTLLLGASACNSTSGTTSSSGASRALTIAVVMGAETDPFFKAMKVGAEAKTAAKNAKLVWRGDPSV